MSAQGFHRRVRQAMQAVALAWACLLAPAQAACPQITTWAPADASWFPVPELSTVSVSPTPGLYYSLFGSGATATQRVTLFSFTGYPRNQRARAFRNAVTVQLYSFVDDSQAEAVFDQDVTNFLRSNPTNWRYELLTTEGQPSAGAPLVYYKEGAAERELHAQRRHGHVIVRIHLFSDSVADAVLVQGVAELADRTRQALELIDRKCGVVPPLTGHGVTIEPDPSEGFAFHEQILEHRGFAIVFRDAHGSDHLDFSTFRLLVGGSATQPGTDTTSHAVGRLTQGIVPFSVSAPDANTRIYRIVPDPALLMKGHDIFAIPFNGDWRIELRICDKDRNCFGTAYTVYFGPFVRFGSATHTRCEDSTRNSFRIESIGVGNIGVDSPGTDIYLGLGTADGRTLWTYHFGEGGLGEPPVVPGWRPVLAPYLPRVSAPSGAWRAQREAEIDASYVYEFSDTVAWRTEFPAGRQNLIAAAVDTATGAHRRFEQVVTICR
ncbi:MAG: hypothetical protein U1F50_21240 [Rubrivivax sp.]